MSPRNSFLTPPRLSPKRRRESNANEKLTKRQDCLCWSWVLAMPVRFHKHFLNKIIVTQYRARDETLDHNRLRHHQQLDGKKFHFCTYHFSGTQVTRQLHFFQNTFFYLRIHFHNFCEVPPGDEMNLATNLSDQAYTSLRIATTWRHAGSKHVPRS